jgi:hypothetical protein
MSIRRFPAPIVDFILSKGGEISNCRISPNPRDVSLNFTFLLIHAIHIDSSATGISLMSDFSQSIPKTLDSPTTGALSHGRDRDFWEPA